MGVDHVGMLTTDGVCCLTNPVPVTEQKMVSVNHKLSYGRKRNDTIPMCTGCCPTLSVVLG